MLSILMEDPQGSYYATMGRDQLRRLLGDRDKRIAELEAAIGDTLAYLKDEEDSPDLGELFTQLEALAGREK